MAGWKWPVHFKRNAAPTLEVLLTLIPKSDHHNNRTMTRYRRPLRRGHPIIRKKKKEKAVDYSLYSAFWTLIFILLSCFSLRSICHSWLVKNATKNNNPFRARSTAERRRCAVCGSRSGCITIRHRLMLDPPSRSWAALQLEIGESVLWVSDSVGQWGPKSLVDLARGRFSSILVLDDLIYIFGNKRSSW